MGIGDTVTELNEMVKKLREEYDKKEKHSFKKGDWVYHKDEKYKMTHLVKVIKCVPTILLVESLEYPGSMPYRIESNFKNCTLVTNKQKWTIRYQKVASPIVDKAGDAILWVNNKLGLNHTTEPKTLRDYAGNWLAFFFTVTARLQNHIYYPGEANTFKDMATHGPLWSGHHYKESLKK